MPGGDHSIAYLCAEFGLGDHLPIYAGGLGVLAGDLLLEAAAQQVPLVGVGLFYPLGTFHQDVDARGQHESTTRTDPRQVPLELVQDGSGETLLTPVPLGNRDIYLQAWRYQRGGVTLYLLDSDHWQNSPEDRAITAQLYGGDQRTRIQQEVLLGIGGYRFLKRMGHAPKTWHLNEGHAAFAGLELVSEACAAGDAPELGRRKVSGSLVYTNHTVVPAGNDAFSIELVTETLERYAFQSNLSMHDILNWGAEPGEPGRFSMTRLALRLAGTSSAVSRLHGQVARQIWPEHSFTPVTNGVHLPRWVGEELTELLNEYAPAWQTRAHDPRTWLAVRRMSLPLFWDAKLAAKGRLVQYVQHETGILLDNEQPIVVWARRFATYKRPDLLLTDLEKLRTLLARGLQVIYAGKAHPSDTQGKEILRHIAELSFGEFRGKLVFLEGYSLTLTQLLVQGADIWLNTPIEGHEASGTSGMKAAANGAIQVTTNDGWAAEVDWYGMGMVIPEGAAAAEGLYQHLGKLMDLYQRRHNGVPERFVAMQRETLVEVSGPFSATRMLREYEEKLWN